MEKILAQKSHVLRMIVNFGDITSKDNIKIDILDFGNPLFNTWYLWNLNASKVENICIL